MTGCDVQVKLLGGFRLLYNGASIRLPLGAQRLIAQLALNAQGLHRSVAAERLWPDSPRGRAAPNLRSALWHARAAKGKTIIERSGPRLLLGADVTVDYNAASREARNLADGTIAPESLIRDLSAALAIELLPDWFDDWLLVERERWNQLRLHALEAAANRWMSEDRYLAALEAAFAATAIEPMRESAHRTVIEIYMAEGNDACAVKHIQHYRRLVQQELGVSPSHKMTELMHRVLSVQ